MIRRRTRFLVVLAGVIVAMAAVLMLFSRSFGDRLWIHDREFAVPTAPWWHAAWWIYTRSCNS